MADDILTFIIAARDNASATLARTSRELRTLGGAGGAAAGPLAKLSAVTGGLVNPATLAIGAVTGLLAGGLALADAAREDETSIALLNTALQENAKDYAGNTTAVEAAITARMALGFTDEDQRTSLGALVAVTKDSTAALGLQRTAMDLARLKGMDLNTATTLLGKVYGGNLGILARYGIQLEKGATATEAIAEIQKRAAGQAEAWAKTSEGSAVTAGIAMEELGEKIGYLLLPALNAVAVFARDTLVPALSEAVDAIAEVAAVIGWVSEQSDILQEAFGDVGDTIRDTSSIELDPKQWAFALHDFVFGAEQEAGAMSQSWAEAWAAMPPQAAQAYSAAQQITEAAAPAMKVAAHAALAEPVNQAALDARAFARREFAKIPSDISSALTNSLPDLNQGLTDLKDLMKNGLSDAKKITELEGILASKALARGLRSKDYDVRAAARALQKSTRQELREIKSGAADAAADGGDAYADWLTRKKNRVTKAAADLAKGARRNLEFDASGAGSGVASTYASGLDSGTNYVRDAAGRLRETVGGMLEFSGSPAYTHSRRIGREVARTWGEGLQEGFGSLRMPGLPQGGSLAGGGVGGGGGGLTVIFQSTFPVSPAQGAEVAAAIGPELTRWQRRNN